MNKDRRSRLDKAHKELGEIQEKLLRLNLAEYTSKVEDIKSEVEAIKDEEQEAFDNMSENLQGGERGQAMQEAISAMENVENELTEAIEAINSLDTITEKIGEALGHIEEAQGS